MLTRPDLRSLARLATLTVGLGLLAATADAQPLVVVGSNVESGEATPGWIGREIIEKIAAHIWGFSEVQSQAWAAAFEEAAEDAHRREYRTILGTTGDEDRLLIMYDDELLDHLETIELHDINIENRVRAPLVARFRVASSGREFLFMVNHLYRGSASGRHRQASLLNQWARQRNLPVIAVGDYNFDWNLPNGDKDHDRGYDNMIRDGVFVWVRPATLVKTQCVSQFNSVLDFVFVSGEAKSWKATSEIQFREPAFCNDDNQRPDHRPVVATFAMSGATTIDPLADVIAHLDELIAEVREQIAAFAALGRPLTDEEKATLTRLEAVLKELENARAASKQS